MRRFVSYPLFLLAALFVWLLPAVAQDNPPQLEQALSALTEYLGRTVTRFDVDSFTYVAARYTDSALGCPYATAQAVPEGVTGYSFDLVIGGTGYNVRVGQDALIGFVCVPVDVGSPVDGLVGTPIPPGVSVPGVSFTPEPCPTAFAGFLPPRLQIGAQARVPLGNTGNRIRVTPSIDGVQIGLLNPNTAATVIGGPSCDSLSRLVWWQVVYEGITGWTAEGELPNNYFVDPVGVPAGTAAGSAAVSDLGPVPGLRALPADRALLTAANVGDLVPLTRIPVRGVVGFAFSPDGTALAMGAAAGIYSYNLPALRPNFAASVSVPGVSDVVYSRNGRYLLYSTTAGEVGGLDVLATLPVARIAVATGAINALSSIEAPAAQATGDTWVAVGSDSRLSIVDVSTGTILSEIAGDALLVRGVAYSPDGRFLAYSDSMTRILDAATSDELVEVPTDNANAPFAWRPVLEVSASDALPLEQLQYARDDGGEIVLRSLAAPDTDLMVLSDADAGVRQPVQIVFSPEGDLMAVLYADAVAETAVLPRVVVFDATSGALVYQVDLDTATGIAFSSDGTLLAIAQDQGVVLLGAL